MSIFDKPPVETDPFESLTPTTAEITREWLHDVPAYFLHPVTLFKNYSRAALSSDAIAGLTVAVVMVPQAIAYALIAELPPTVGLYSGIVAAVISALWGSSFHVATGPANAMSLLTLGAMLPILAPDSPDFLLAAAVLAILVGLIQLLMGMLKLGFLVNFVSDAVILGFTSGASILIAANQLKHLFRVEIPSTPKFYVTVYEVALQLGKTHFLSLGVGILTIVVILISKRISSRLPHTLLGMVAAALVVFIFNLDDAGVITLGDLPRGLPPLTNFSGLSWELFTQLLSGSVAVAIIGLVSTMSISKSLATRSGQRIDSNQEFVGQGLANIGTGLFSGMPVTGSLSRSAVNFEANAQSNFANLFSGIFVLLILLLIAPLTAFLPRAALAGVLMVTAYNMLGLSKMQQTWRISQPDGIVMLVTLFGTLFLPLSQAVFAGIFASFALYIWNTANPNVFPVLPDNEYNHLLYQPDKAECPQMGVLSVAGSLYFGATSHVEEAIRNHKEENPEQKLLLLRLHRVNQLDISGLHTLEDIVRLYREDNGDVYIANLRREHLAKVKESGFYDLLGADHFLEDANAIGHLFYNTLDPAICVYNCPHRVWHECQNLPKDNDHKLNIELNVKNGELTVPSIKGEELLKWTERTIIDVRLPEEYEAGHIAEAISIPLYEILSPNLNFSEEESIVFVCQRGRRSGRAVKALLANPDMDVSILDGGMDAWVEAGLPMTQASSDS